MSTDPFFCLPDYFTSLINAMQDGFVLRAPDGSILEANTAFCALIGYSREEVVGQRPPHPWWPDEERSTFEHVAQRYLAGAAREDDLVYLHKSGERIPMLVTNAPIRDAGGRVIGFIGMMKDMRERQQTEAHIQFQSELIDRAQTAIIATDTAGVVTVWNQGAEHLYGWSRAEALGQNIGALLVSVDQSADGVEILESVVAGTAWNGEFTLRRKDGAIVPVFASDSPIFNADGEVVGVIGVSVDLSERKRSEELLQTQYRVTRLLAESNSIEAAAMELPRIVGEQLDWDLGGFWLADDEVDRLRCVAIWQRRPNDTGAFETAARGMLLGRNEGMPGRAWVSGAPLWIEDITREQDFPRRAVAEAAGLRGAFCVPIRDSGGAIGAIEFLSTASRPPDNSLLTVAATIGDQTGQFIERIRAIQATRESEDRFRSMADSAPVMLWVSGLDMGCTWFNHSWLEFTGRSLEQGLGNGWTEGVHPDDLTRCIETYTGAFRRREPFVMEYRLRKHTGEYCWLLDHGRPRFNPDGSFAGFIGSCINISERKRTEESLRFLAEASTILASSLDYRTTLNSVARLIVPTLADWCAVHIVEAPGEFTQVAVAHIDPTKIEWAYELQQKYPTDPNAPTGLPYVLRTGASEIYPDISEEMLVAIAKDDEHLATVRAIGFSSAMIVPMIAREQVVGAITIVAAESGRRYTQDDLALAEDLARRAAVAVDNARLFQAAQDATVARDRFLAIAAHELRSPLTSTKGFAQLLLRRAKRQPGSEEWIAPLTTIDNQVNKVATLVSRLLDVARIQEDRLELQLEPGDLLEIVREAVVEQQLVAEDRQIVLTADLRELPGAWDRTRLGQVLTNLLDNALKYGPSDAPVTVDLRRTDDEALISVHDEGVGIPPASQAHLFERNFRSRAATQSTSEGMGLGLYVAKGIVDAHGGRIWIDSHRGDGTTFYVALPLKPRPAAVTPT